MKKLRKLTNDFFAVVSRNAFEAAHNPEKRQDDIEAYNANSTLREHLRDNMTPDMFLEVYAYIDQYKQLRQKHKRKSWVNIPELSIAEAQMRAFFVNFEFFASVHAKRALIKIKGQDFDPFNFSDFKDENFPHATLKKEREVGLGLIESLESIVTDTRLWACRNQEIVRILFSRFAEVFSALLYHGDDPDSEETHEQKYWRQTTFPLRVALWGYNVGYAKRSYSDIKMNTVFTFSSEEKQYLLGQSFKEKCLKVEDIIIPLNEKIIQDLDKINTDGYEGSLW